MTVTKNQKETYNAEKAGNYSIKFRHNYEYTKRITQSYFGQHIILDSSDNQTGRALKAIGIQKENILCPNFTREVVDQHNANNILTSFHTTLGELVESNVCCMHGVDSAWLDACSSWKGNKAKKIFIKKDIKRFFERKLLVSENGVFSVTISVHGEKGGSDKHAKKVINEILKMGKLNGYNLKSEVCEFYGKRKNCKESVLGMKSSAAMLFLLFVN